MHGRFAEAVGGEFSFVDFRLRWQDREMPRIYVIASWFVCALTFPGRRDYDVFLVDGVHVGPVVMKRLFLRSDQKLIAHLGSHTMYFLLTHQFGRWVERLYVWALSGYDALICEGRMTADIVREVLGDDHPAIYEVFWGVRDDRLAALTAVKPNLATRRLVSVAGGPQEFRMYYKGLDLMIDAFAIVAGSDPAIEFDIVGTWDGSAVAMLLGRLPADLRGRVNFVGAVTDIAEYARTIGRSPLYLQCSRGDAGPIAVIEAMLAGLVPIVSEWTGVKQLAIEVCERLVAPLDAAAIAERIAWYLALGQEERARLSERSRVVAAPYLETLAVEHYQTVFTGICADLQVGAD